MWTTLRVSEFAPDGTAYDISGPKGAPCVVLIHGLGLCKALWDSHLPALAGCRVLRYDLYGHGQSAPTPRPADLTLFADQIASLMNHLSIRKAHIVGFSIGGMINRKFAQCYPNKVDSLAILNAPHNRGAKAQSAVEERAQSVRDQGAFSTFDAALQRWFTPAYLATGEGPDLVRYWRGLADAESYAQTAWVLAHGVRELIAPDPALTCPALVMTCENDSGSTPKMSADITAEIKGAQMIIVPKLQHLGLMEDPAAFVEPVVKFVKRIAT